MSKLNQLAAVLDKLDETQKSFALWYLLPVFIEATRQYAESEPKNERDELARQMAMNLAKNAEEIRDILAYKVF